MNVNLIGPPFIQQLTTRSKKTNPHQNKININSYGVVGLVRRCVSGSHAEAAATRAQQASKRTTSADNKRLNSNHIQRSKSADKKRHNPNNSQPKVSATKKNPTREQPAPHKRKQERTRLNPIVDRCNRAGSVPPPDRPRQGARGRQAATPPP